MTYQEIWLKIKNYILNQPLWKMAVVIFVLVIFFITPVFYFIFWNAPKNFPIGTFYTVGKNVSLGEVADELEAKNIIRSPFWFKTFFILYYGSSNLNYGDYVLNTPENIFGLAKRFDTRDYQLKTFKITIPEGLNRLEIAELFKGKLNKISQDDFLVWSKRYEGYLFPDTYFWSENITTSEIVTAMNLNFQTQTKNLMQQASTSKRDFSDVVKMASIIELEANNDTDRKIISDILWRRLKIGMLLQVNSTLKYIGEKNTMVLTIEQTKIDSPYNTYKNKGLPPTPISNPGLESLQAAMSPTSNKYLYFLTGKDGKMYYAKTYEEHLLNKEKYLK